MSAVYEARPVKRGRATRAEMERRRDALLDLAREHRPASVRNIYYRAVVAGLVPKDDGGYRKVQTMLVELRRSGALPYEWLTDNARWRRRADTWDGVDEVLELTARTYRRALWTRSAVTVEVWCESDSIAGTIWPVTERWDVDLLPVRGFSSLTFAYSSAMELNRQERPAVIYYVGDHDPAGLGIEAKLREYLEEFCTVPVKIERVGVTWEQVEAMNLPGTTPKKAYGYPLAVEAEAIPPGVLRDLVESAIHEHLDEREVHLLELVEREERVRLLELAREFGQ